MTNILEVLRHTSELYHEGNKRELIEFLKNLGMHTATAEAFASYELLPPEPERVESLLAGSNYQALIDALGLRQQGTPRNLPAWQVVGTAAGFPVVALGKNLFAGNIDPNPPNSGHSTLGNVSFMNIVRGKEVGVPLSVALANRLRVSKSEGTRFTNDIQSLGCILPNNKMSMLIAEVLGTWQEGGEAVIWGAFCPDYSYEPTGDPVTPYRYTFKSVGGGVGLVAERLITLAEGLHTALRNLGVTPRFVFVMADTEANIPGLCERLGINRGEFLKCCRSSVDEVHRTLKEKGVPASVEMFYEQYGARFDEYEVSARVRMKQGDFGGMVSVGVTDPVTFVGKLTSKYASFYEAWHGRTTEEQNRRRVVTQAAAYAAFARVMMETYPTSMQIAADRPDMQAFGAVSGPLAMLCRSQYYV